MVALNDIIDFLLGLLRDEKAQAEFAQDPDGTLAEAGLDGITGQDVRDAQLLMADSGAVRSDGGGSSHGGGNSVQEITHVTQHYHVTESGPNVINIDDRDTIINDSFNSDDDVTIIDDSFNDVTDIDIQAEDSFNSSVENDVTAIQDNDTIINDNDVIDIEDNDTVTEVVESQPEAEPEPEPEPEPEAAETDDVDADVDAAVL